MNTLALTNRYTRLALAFIAVTISVTALFSLVLTQRAGASPVVGFDPQNIIDDYVFTNTTTMNADQIQVFLNSKVPICDTDGVQVSEFGGGTRAQWAASKGYYPPFTCLKDYYENGRSAAQIIYDTAQQYQINPQVLIVLLQKEQSLVTDTWPLSLQYKTATGYGCPDTAACDSQYFGLTNQIHWSATMFRAILNNSPTWYTPYVIGTNYVRWSPTSSCGGTNLNIQNRATQALYNYTPYQPNTAALNAGYGMGDSCSAYGNRNFYLYFTDWFGSVIANDTFSPHPEGTLVNINNAIYLIQGGTLHHIVNGTVFDSNDYKYSDVKPATSGDKRLTESWPLNFIEPGTLYTGDPSGVYTTVYENNVWVKRLVSYASFMSLGYSWSQVKAVNSLEMPATTSATVLTTSQHPDGTLIKNSQGVFMLDHGTRRYVSAAVFASQKWNWGDILTETTTDSALPKGADMLLKEGTIVSNKGNLYAVSIPSTGAEIKKPIGPWSCYANVMKYTIQDALPLDDVSLPVQTGANISC
ncbi:MAG TPA: hypothetical protein VIM37_03980 [Candidatus Microsaccharimonas sp.]|jgi:hypothetical protein